MELMPATGEVMKVGDIHQEHANIQAGVKYFHFMVVKYYGNEPMDDLNKVLFTFAAYNCGPGRVKQLRTEAAQKGFDPNVWLGNVEMIAAARVGTETVNYVSNRRFTMILLAVFAGLAVLLASIGIYGVVSYVVGQRTHDIGIRMALRAERERIAHGVKPGREIGDARYSHWPAGIPRVDPPHGQHAFPGEFLRSSDLFRCGSNLVRCGPPRLLHTRSPRLSRRSNDRFALRIE